MKNPLQTLSSLPKRVWGITIATMLISISTTMTFSISPFFMTTVLGMSVFSMGALEGLSEGLSQVSKLFSGIITDTKGRKKSILIFGFFLAAISKPFFILAQGVSAVATSKILERISNGIIATPRDAYVASISQKDNQGACFGVMMTGKTIGCMVGPFLVSLLMFFIKDYRLLLWFGFIPCVISIFILVRYMHDEGAPPPKKSKNAPPHPAPSLCPPPATKFSITSIKELPFSYWMILITASIFMLARFTDGLVALRIKELGAPDVLYVATMGIFNGISALCCFPIGYLYDKISRVKLFYFSYLGLLIANLCLLFATDVSLGLVGVVFWGAQRGTSQLLFTAVIADEVPKKVIGTAMGLFHITTGVICLIAGLIGGVLADPAKLQDSFVARWMGDEFIQNGLSNTFSFGSIVATFALFSLFLINRLIAGQKTRKANLAIASAELT